MARGRIYIDIDDVLAMTSTSLLDLLHEHHGKRVDYEDLVHFSLERSFGLSSDEVHRLLERAHEPEILALIEPIPGCREVLGSWLEAGYEVDLLTGRPPSCDESTRLWLEENALPYSNLFFVDKYQRADRWDPAGVSISLEEMKQMDFILAVEDSPQVAVILAESMKVDVALIDRPWNRDVSHMSDEARQRIQRCHTWEDVAKFYALP